MFSQQGDFEQKFHKLVSDPLDYTFIISSFFTIKNDISVGNLYCTLRSKFRNTSDLSFSLTLFRYYLNRIQDSTKNSPKTHILGGKTKTTFTFPRLVLHQNFSLIFGCHENFKLLVFLVQIS